MWNLSVLCVGHARPCAGHIRRWPVRLKESHHHPALAAPRTNSHGKLCCGRLLQSLWPFPSSWDWLASKHLVKLPHPLNPEDTRMVEEGDSQEAWDTESGPIDSPALPSLAPSNPSPAPQPQKVAKPPPPIYPSRRSPSPAKSSVPSKGHESWDGDWNQKRDCPWDWNTRRWRR